MSAVPFTGMQLGLIHHVGYVVADLDAEIAVYRDTLGMPVGVREVMPEQGVDAVLMGAGPSYVELIAPVTEDTGVARFLAKKGPGMHHVAFAVPHLESTLRELAAEGVELIDTAPRRGLGGHLVAFLHPRSTGGVLTELVEQH
jgi:methylmalonyl-CoA/ethylmalonyl-CoA epimerase